MAEEMTAKELADKLGSDDIVVVDVRSPERYEAGHVEGATNIPLDEIKERIPGLPKDKLIVTYCGGGTSGPTAAAILAEKGYRTAVMEGMRAWEASGLPTVQGSEPS